MTNPKFTVIIPTRERVDVLRHALRTVIEQDYDNLEIIVSDNFSTDGTRETVHAFNDARIRYINTGKRVSMTQNWEFALGHVADGWVTILGDDDGLLKHALHIVRDIASQESGVFAIRSTGCSYAWPLRTEHGNGRLVLPRQEGHAVVGCHEVLGEVLAARKPYTYLPMLYNGGFVHSDLLRKARQLNGRMFNSVIPDVYSGVVLSMLTDRYVLCRTPLAIDGGSHHGTGHSYFQSKANPAPMAVFRAENEMKFHADLGVGDELVIRSIDLIVFESYLQASSLLGVDPSSAFPKILRLVLAKARRDQSQLVDWGDSFSSMHHLPLPSAPRLALARTDIWWRDLVDRCRKQFSSIVIEGTEENPIPTVHEAALRACEELEAAPRFFRGMATLTNNVRRIFRRRLLLDAQ